MHAFDKNSVSAEVLQNHFAETKNGFGKHVEIYTDGNQIKSMRLPDKSSVYTAELSAIRMALELIRRLKEKSFVIYSDSLSSLQAIQSLLRHPNSPLLGARGRPAPPPPVIPGPKWPIRHLLRVPPLVCFLLPSVEHLYSVTGSHLMSAVALRPLGVQLSDTSP